ncbi:6-hydroxymethylpterin diphosphokinase MptE-like protein [Shewanella mangrovisoli]|uniref:6-hydroxymethylpterin diphosphokinase MptE-like protein n=1 Tax=Shewanella mangrovisoli TaxID=2864211 RepID=UPI0035B91E1C
MQLQSNIQNNFAISRFNEYYLPSVNRNTFEGIDSKTFYDRKFKKLFSQTDKLNIIIGMDSGLLANYILELSEGISDGSKFVIIELSTILPLLLIDIPNELQRKLLIIDESGLDELFKQDDIKLFIAKGEYRLIPSSSVSSHHIDDYNTLFNIVESRLQNEYFDNSVNFTQKIFVKTQLENISDNHTQAKELRNTYKEMNCIVIAGGPSLDNAIHWIKENQDSLYVIAVSRIAGKLAKFGINVDIVVCVDPQDFSFDVSRGMFELSDETLLVHSYHVNPKVLSQWQGKCLYMGQRFPWNNENDFDNIPTVGPTVTNSAVRLAIEMGFSKILLSGVDFCYSKSGYSHASGTVEASLGPSLGHDTLWVSTYAGYQAETLIQLKQAMESLEHEAKTYPHVDIINLSSNAAYIEGITHQTTEMLTLTPIVKNSSQSDSHFITIKKDDLEKAYSQCKITRNEIVKLQNLVNNAKMHIPKLSLDSKKSSYTLDNINKIELKINKKYKPLSQLIKFYGYFEFSKFLTTREVESWTQQQINQMTERYYEAFSSTCNQVFKLIDNACTKLEYRINELKNTPLSILAEQWKKDNQPGRCIIWKRMHPEYIFSKDEELLWAELNNLYQISLTQVRQAYVETLNTGSSMEHVYTKILRLNKSKSLQGLALITQNLKPLIEEDLEAKRLYHLALSFQLSLEQRHQQSLDALLALPEELYTEMELKHIILLALKLGNLELAEDTLVKILTHSDEYMPQYAHILKLRGKIQESVNIYLDYLEKYPSDTQTWIKLGLFMVELGQAEGAHTAFSNALNADPDNQVAQHYAAELTRIMSEAK